MNLLAAIEPPVLIWIAILLFAAFVVGFVILLFKQHGPQGQAPTGLLACPACNHQVSSAASTCPACGQPLAARGKWTAKLILALVFAGVAIWFLWRVWSLR